jgi:hypothetical protein
VVGIGIGNWERNLGNGGGSGKRDDMSGSY